MDLSDYLNQGISDTQAAVRTYSTYSAAWCIWTEKDSPKELQRRLSAFARLQPSKHSDPDLVSQHLLRGRLTLDLIRQVPTDERPDFAMTSALWLPVQTYYAVHGFGMACLAARSAPVDLPRTHGAFMRRAGTDIVGRLLPSPFSAVLQGGYRGYKHVQPDLLNIPDDRQYIGSGTNLQRPNSITRNAHIVQCLATTRRRLIEARLKEARKKATRPGKSRTRLLRDTQIQLVSTVAPTTLFDYLYRTRIKSNYEDPTMYALTPEDSDAVIELVRSTKELAEKLCALLAAVLQKTTRRAHRDLVFKGVNLQALFSCIETS